MLKRIQVILHEVQNFTPTNLHDIEELQQDVSKAARKSVSGGKRKNLTLLNWYAAAGIIAILGLTIVMVFMSRNPVNQSQLAIAQTDTMINKDSGEAPPEQEHSVSETDLAPVTQQETRIKINEDIVSECVNEILSLAEIVSKDKGMTLDSLAKSKEFDQTIQSFL